MLVGLQLPTVIEGLEGIGTWELIGNAALVAATVIAVRMDRVFPLTYPARPSPSAT